MVKSSKSPSPPEIEEDISFQSKFWSIQKFGLGLMAAFIVMALLGFTGSGPINADTVSDNTLEVRYSPFIRLMSPAKIEIYVMSSGVRDARLSLWVERSFLEKFKIEKITPEPDTVLLEETRIFYEINTAGMVESGKVTFDVQPNSAGFVSGSIGQGDGKLTLRQFVFP